MTLTSQIKRFLSGKTATIAIITLVITVRIIQLVFIFNLRSDRCQQVLATQNLVSGNGVSLSKVYGNDLSQSVHVPLTKWPPGYTLILAPIFSLSGNDYIIACMVLDILFAVILIFTARRIMIQLNVQKHRINLFTLLTGCFLYPFYLKPSSDAIAITLFLVAISFSLSLVNGKRTSAVLIGGIIVSLLLCGLLKYSYQPLIFIIPAMFIIAGRINKTRRLIKTGILVLSVLGISILSLLLYQKSVSGSAVYITQPVRGFFPGNLLSAYPFIPAAILTPETTGSYLSQGSIPGTPMYIAFQCIHVFAVLMLAAGLWIFFRKNKIREIDGRKVFLFLTIGISAIICGLLALLSVNVEKEDFGTWTYVQEARYYGLVAVLLQICFFVYWRSDKVANLKLLKYAGVLLVILLSAEAIRGIVFAGNRIRNFKKEEYVWQAELRMQEYFDVIAKQSSQKYSTSTIVMTGTSDYINNRLSLYSDVPQLDEISLINDPGSLHTSKSIVLLVALRKDSMLGFEPFLQSPLKEFAGEFAGFYFYTMYVQPR